MAAEAGVEEDAEEEDAEEENKLNYWSLFNLYLEKRLKILSLFNQGY